MTQPPQGWNPQQGNPGQPPQAPGYPQSAGYPPQGPTYPQQQPGYPPQGPGYPPQNPGYPPQGGFNAPGAGQRPAFSAPPPSSGPNTGKVCLIIAAVAMVIIIGIVALIAVFAGGLLAALSSGTTTTSPARVSSAPVTRATTSSTTPVTRPASTSATSRPASTTATVAAGTKSVQGQTMPDKVGSYTKLSSQDKPSTGVAATAVYTANGKPLIVILFDNTTDVAKALPDWKPVGSNICGAPPAGAAASGSGCGRVMKDGFLMVIGDDTPANLSVATDQLYASFK